jgi:L-ascorbate metabolism protein UlaG (beta-lactamase superfamily)
MKLKFYRHATFLLTIDDTRILVDPMLRKKGSLPPIPSTLDLRRNPLEEFPGALPGLTDRDIVLITHHHFDHFDEVAARLLPKQVAVVTPENGAKRLERRGFQNIVPMRARQQVVLRDLTILATPVKHTERLGRLLYKPGLGYLIQGRRESTFVSGDTTYSKELVTCLQPYPIHVAILYGGGARLPILGRHTLSHREVLLLAEQLGPRHCVVVHLDSLNHCPERRHELRHAVVTSKLRSSVITPLPGEQYGFS